MLDCLCLGHLDVPAPGPHAHVVRGGAPPPEQGAGVVGGVTPDTGGQALALRLHLVHKL